MVHPHLTLRRGPLHRCTQPHSLSYHRQFTSESQAEVAWSQIGYKEMPLRPSGVEEVAQGEGQKERATPCGPFFWSARLGFADAEDSCPAFRAHTLDRRTLVLQRYGLGILDLYLLLALHAIRLRHSFSLLSVQICAEASRKSMIRQ